MEWLANHLLVDLGALARVRGCTEHTRETLAADVISFGRILHFVVVKVGMIGLCFNGLLILTTCN